MAQRMRYKNAWLGVTIIVVGALQTVLPDLQALLPEVPSRVFGVVTILLGVIVRANKLIEAEEEDDAHDDAKAS